jgi:dTDP-4-amino-4,6-dideoxygalactose transaminase
MPIFISSTPTVEKDDLSLSKDLLKGKQINDIEVKLPGFKNKKHFFTNTGRGSLYLILKALDITKGDEVIIQSFTCMAVIVPLKWLKITPIYADIETNTYNISLDSIKKRISKKTRAIIVQHTFAIPAEVKKIKKHIEKVNKERKKEKKIYLIEDCAHSLNRKIEGKYLGTFGDASFFSFGQDKVVSTTQGGCVVVNRKKLEKKIEKEYKKILNMPNKTVKYNLRYPILWSVIKKYYYFPNFLAHSNIFSKLTIGKFLIVVFRTLGLIKQQASKDEFGDPDKDIYKLSNEQKYLLKNQLEKIVKFTQHRKNITKQYSEKLQSKLSGPLIRYPILVDEPNIVKSKLQKERIIIGNWYNYPVIPKGIDFKQIQYHLGSCPNTEYVMDHIVNLPTDINVKNNDVNKILDIIMPHLI